MTHIGGNVGLSILPMDTLPCRLVEPQTEPPSGWWVTDLPPEPQPPQSITELWCQIWNMILLNLRANPKAAMTELCWPMVRGRWVKLCWLTVVLKAAGHFLAFLHEGLMLSATTQCEIIWPVNENLLWDSNLILWLELLISLLQMETH